MPTLSSDYTSSVTLLVTGESLNPLEVSAALNLECHESWVRGQSKQVGTEPHLWGGWKRHQPDDMRSATIEEQISYWTQVLLPKAEALASISRSGNRCVLDAFFIAETAWFRLSKQLNQQLASLPLEVEFSFWAPTSAA